MNKVKATYFALFLLFLETYNDHKMFLFASINAVSYVFAIVWRDPMASIMFPISLYYRTTIPVISLRESKPDVLLPVELLRFDSHQILGLRLK